MFSKEARDIAFLTARSTWNHTREIKPAALREPSMYAGKVESTIITLFMDTFGVTPKDIPSRDAFFRSLTAFNLQWRAYDEVLDEEKYTTDPITEQELADTPVAHPYMDRRITGAEGFNIALGNIMQVIPGNDKASRSRRSSLEELMYRYRETVADTANNPKYHTGDVLPYDTAVQSKKDITAYLGESAATMYALLLDREGDHTVREIFGRTAMAMQFGDDYLDWRKDWRSHNERANRTGAGVRPSENLLQAVLADHPDEYALCEQVLTDPSMRSALFLKELAPRTLDDFRGKFQDQIDRFPPHPKSDMIKGILSATFYKILPRAPESGWFVRWAKY